MPAEGQGGVRVAQVVPGQQTGGAGRVPVIRAALSSWVEFGSNLIVGVTSFGMNSLCRGTDYAYRVDTKDVLDWINGGYLAN